MSAQHSTVLFSTIHPVVLPYVKEWADSVHSQSDKNFDLVVALDGVTEDQLAEMGVDRLSARFLVAADGATPAEVRNAAFGELVEEYETLVLVDADDVLGPDRVAAAKRDLETVDVSACALHLIDELSNPIGRDFCVLDAENAADFDRLLPRANVFGLSNSSYRSETLRACLPVPSDCVIVDWYLVTKAWASGARLHLDPRPLMSYRQHSTNIAKVLPPFSAQTVRVATELVLEHYAAVLAHAGLEGARRDAVIGAQEKASRLSATVLPDDALLDSYVSRLNQLPPPQAWWTIVAHPDLEELWTR